MKASLKQPYGVLPGLVIGLTPAFGQQKTAFFMWFKNSSTAMCRPKC